MHAFTLTPPVRAAVIIFCLTVALAGGARAASTEWASEHNRDHALVGTIWSAETKAAITREAYLDQVSAARFILLGEIHPNRDHHRLQAEVLKDLIRRGRRPAVVFEMVSQNMQWALDDFRARKDGTLDELREAIKWDESGWPDWSMYAPLFELALANDLPIRAGNPSRAETKGLWKEIKAGLSDEKKRRYALDAPLGDGVQDKLRTHIAEAHCNLLPEKMIDPMTSVQRAKDGVMANTLMDADQGDGAVLISGSGHVRRDWAVPFVIKARKPDARIAVVAYYETHPNYKTVQDYLPETSHDRPVFDILYFTPLADNRDHCAELKKKFQK